MSGIEVAGLILGAIPLIISALENYEALLGPTVAFFKYGNELSRATRQLSTQYALYEQSIRIILRPIVDKGELDEMMENTGSPLWKVGQVEDSLKEKLGKAYYAYIGVVGDIQKSIVSIAERLDLDGADRITQDGLDAIVSANPAAMSGTFEYRRRVKFTMKRQKIKKTLDELIKANDSLDKMFAKAEKLEEPFNVMRTSKLLPIRLIRDNAARLYDVLSRSWCSSHSSHSAGILLEQRLVKRKRGTLRNPDAEIHDSNHFGVSLLQTQTPKKWLDAEFRISDSIECVKQKNPKVRILISDDRTSSSSSPLTLTADPSHLRQINDICSILQQPSFPWMGFLVEEYIIKGTYQAQDRKFSYTERGIGLEEILVKPSASLTKEEIYTLSITLTSSLLQLNSTPWLQQSWSKADILFLRQKDGSALSVDVKHPYLTHEHIPDNTQVVRHNSTGNDCSKLLALGVMLLEISSGQPIESLRRPEDLGPNDQPNEFTDLRAARRWLFEQKDAGNLSFAFYSAISYCLKCFVDPQACLERQDFSCTVEEKVLAPLEQEMNILLFGSSP